MRTRRFWLTIVGLIVMAGQLAADEPQRPNILFVFADDHACQAISAYGHKLNRTPNIDRIAAHGMRFDRCLVTNSICGPSRAVILTGNYLACIASVDESVGRLLDHLQDAGLEENTIVVFSSDQGFYLGEHGWFDKRWIFEESLRTPLLVRWPGVVKPKSVNSDLVSNLDFAETFLEAAGVNVPDEMQGRSLGPILKGYTPNDWRKSFYYHYYEYPGPHDVRRHYGVVTDRYKLVHFYEPDVNYWELFDRNEDPRELMSVYGQPDQAKVQKELEAELALLRKRLRLPEHDPP